MAAKEESTSHMGAQAAIKALKAANKTINDIDLILVATLSPDYIFPSTACLIQDQLGGKNCAAMDIQAACSGFIYALSVAKAFIKSNTYSKYFVSNIRKTHFNH